MARTLVFSFIEETKIEDRNAEINQTVYDLFDLAKDEQNVTADYLVVL